MLKICQNCHKEFETPTTRLFCYKPKCEKARLARAKEMSKQSSKRWCAHTYKVYKDVKPKSKVYHTCQHCGKQTTNRINCRACLYKLSKRVPDYYNVYDNWGDQEWEGEEGKEVINLELE